MKFVVSRYFFLGLFFYTLQLVPNSSDTVTIAQEYYNLAQNFDKTKLYDKATEFYKKAIKLHKECTSAYIPLGIILEKQKSYKDALFYYQQAVKLCPSEIEAHVRLGKLLKKFDRIEDAYQEYKQALEINPHHLIALLEMANILTILEQHTQAMELYLKALDINPSLDVALYNIGFTFKKLGYIHEAIATHEILLEKNPNYFLAHFSLGMSYLTIGDFEHGWQKYEWRWQAFNENPKKFDCPIWNGENLFGKTIIVYVEQGLEDTLQFIRYTKKLKKQGATVILHIQHQSMLIPLLKLCPDINNIITLNDSIPTADFHVALLSLPLLCNTTVTTIPTTVPYIYINQQLFLDWQKKLASNKNFKIGICWQGNAQYQTESLRRTVVAKSFHPKLFKPLAQLPGVALYSLQKINGTEKLDEINNEFIIHQFGPDFDNTHGPFMDTAAIMKNLDLVLTVDTSIAHLAGGLGIPVWTLLPLPADWRWMIEHTDSPWYPTMQLFRQEKSGDWESVIKKVVSSLKNILPSENKN